MNVPRGLFRIWLVLSGLFVLAMAYVAYVESNQQLRGYEDVSFLDAFALLPVACDGVRGEAQDYEIRDGLCWYSQEAFRRLYPEYKDVNIHDLNERLYAKAGRPSNKPRPWATLAEKAAIAFGVPLAVFAVGWSVLWAFSGFRAEPRG